MKASGAVRLREAGLAACALATAAWLGAGPALAQSASLDPPEYLGVLEPAGSGAGQPWTPVTWLRTPDLRQVEHALPSGWPSAGRTEWDCGVARDGGLADCRLEAAWPKRPGLDQAARSLLPLFQVSQADARNALANRSRMLLEVDLEDARRQVQDIPGDCPPPFCSAVPPPPPRSR